MLLLDCQPHHFQLPSHLTMVLVSAPSGRAETRKRTLDLVFHGYVLRVAWVVQAEAVENGVSVGWESAGSHRSGGTANIQQPHSHTHTHTHTRSS
jgi:hypothetical protein